MNIVITGPKGAGKSAVASRLARRLGLPLVETDARIEEIFEAHEGKRLTCREIFSERGPDAFRALEREAVAAVSGLDFHILATGGSTLLDPDSRRALRPNSILVYTSGDAGVLWERATKRGIPPWLAGPDGPEQFRRDIGLRDEVLRPFADILLDACDGDADARAERLAEAIALELASRCQSPNTCGEIVRMTTFGESHGPAIGAVLDGLRPGIEIDEEAIQRELDRRRPGQSAVTTQRKEDDKVHILSGVFEGRTTGHPVAMIIYNKDQKPSAYDALRELFRPGHADFTFYRKYGFRDHRGGGRSSARETAARVACGAVARGILAERGVRIVAHTVEIGGIRAEACDYDIIESNVVRCADSAAAARMEEAILDVKRQHDSLGGVVQLDVIGLPAGLGDPVFFKLDARLTSALMTIPATKGIEVGAGFALSRMRGSQANDQMADGGFLSNNAGGILGGISNGQPVIVRVGIKPTSSIARKQRTIDTHGANRDIEVVGRHDPCVVPRAVPIVENIAALVLLDAWELQGRLRPEWR